jgi:hypothetical protein
VAGAQEIRPGVYAGPVEKLPLPRNGYDVYLVGEWHGLAENEQFQIGYLKLLHSATGLRDVAIEEDAVYEKGAQDFVDGKSEELPHPICLRAGILEGIRSLNSELRDDAKIRVHLTDVDSPAHAIRQHLEMVRGQLRANVKIPAEAEIKTHGLDAVAQLKRLATDADSRSALRTIEYSIQAYQQGLEVEIAPPKGSPYLDSREQAVASNIEELIRVRQIPSVLVIYGIDHVSGTPRKDGGPKRDQPFVPMALRLQRSGLKTYSLATYPLSGNAFWRGQKVDTFSTPEDGRLESGETLEKVLAAASGAPYLFIDRSKQRARLPSQDVSKMETDGFLLFPAGTPMKDRCGLRP